MTKPPESVVGIDVIEEMCALAATTPSGAFVEVGVYNGGTAWYLAKLAEEQQREIFLYDTFEGIPHYSPEHGDAHRIGDFADTFQSAVERDIPYAVVVPGVFPESAVSMPPVAFVHLDVDQYQSYRDSIILLRTRMVPRGIMWFDDDCLPGAHLAIIEQFSPDKLIRANCGKLYVKF